MGKKNEDYCHICGEYTNLTFEHIPPKKAGNQTKVNEINGDVLIESLTDHKRLPWDFKGLKYKQKQTFSEVVYDEYSINCLSFNRTWCL